MKMSGELHAPAASPIGKEPCYPLDRRMGRPQSWRGCSREERKSLILPGIRLKNSHTTYCWLQTAAAGDL